jgi:hypothetical protein
VPCVFIIDRLNKNCCGFAGSGMIQNALNDFPFI